MDYYGRPVNLNFNLEQKHNTIFGGMLTIFVVISFSYYFLISMLSNDQFYLKDTITTTSFRYGYSEPIAAMNLSEANQNAYNFEFFMSD
jgi:hypothetical protein